MIRRLRLLAAAAALAAGSAHAQQLLQTQVAVPPALEVQRLAPQLVAFAGGDANFQNLVNGLALGLPVTLTTPLAAGATQVVSFTPVGTLTPLQIAQVLENARQVAIANGIAAPTAQQLGVILNGGALPTAAGSTSTNGLIGGNGVNTALSTSTAAPSVQLQQTPRFARSDSPLPRGISDTPLAPPLSASPLGIPASGANAAAGATAPRALEPARAPLGAPAATPTAPVSRFGDR
jgi:hypothetical protein